MNNSSKTSNLNTKNINSNGKNNLNTMNNSIKIILQ